MKTESLIIATATVATLVVTHIYAFLYTPPSTEKIIKTVFIPQGASFNVIARELEKEDIITDAGKFSLLAQFKDAMVLGNANMVDMNGFIVKAKDKVFAASLDIDGSSVEGYLFPDTYKLTK